MATPGAQVILARDFKEGTKGKNLFLFFHILLAERYVNWLLILQSLTTQKEFLILLKNIEQKGKVLMPNNFYFLYTF